MTVPVVIGAGLVAMDVVFQEHSPEPVLTAAGGTCGNVLSVLGYLGWRALPIARLADDPARRVVVADLARWGVDTSFVSVGSPRSTPIIVERIIRTRAGAPSHRFSWTCPCCGAWLPRYQPVTAQAAEVVLDKRPHASVYFFDRTAASSLTLARSYAANGALVVFEPSATSNPKHFEEAIGIAHVVKYSDERLAAIPTTRGRKRRMEIQTLGSSGLRFRILGEGRAAWRRLPAFSAGVVVDTAGCGDWCTAGFLSRIATEGRAGFERATYEDIAQALRYGQGLSAWNCRFAGARGGMYERTLPEFRDEVAAILAGNDDAPVIEVGPRRDATVERICPACPQAKRHSATRSSTREQPNVARNR